MPVGAGDAVGAVGVGDAELVVGVGEGELDVGLGDRVGEGELDVGTGVGAAGKGTTGSSARAAVMKAVQMRAG